MKGQLAKKVGDARADSSLDSEPIVPTVVPPQRPTPPAPAGFFADLDRGRVTNVPQPAATVLPPFDLEGYAKEADRARGVICWNTVPAVVKPADPSLSLRAMFVLGHVDGVSNIAEIARMTGLELDDCLALFRDLYERDAIEARGPDASGQVRIHGGPVASGIRSLLRKRAQGE